MTCQPITVQTILRRGGSSGRSLRWDHRTCRLWWADATGEALLAWSQGETQAYKRRMQDRVLALCPCRSGRLLVALSKRLCLIAMPANPRRALESAQVLHTVEAADPRIVVTDGRADRMGNFVFGTGNLGGDGRAIGSFFQLSHAQGLRRLALPTVTHAGSICFSGSGERMYFADTAGGTLFTCHYDAKTGKVGPPAAVIRCGPGWVVRDALVDGFDHIWTLQGHPRLGSQIVRQGPGGPPEQVLALKRGGATGLALVGQDTGQLMVVGKGGKLEVLAHLTVSCTPEALFDDSRYGREGQMAAPNLSPHGALSYNT